jgi:flagellin-like hook-associated protein FlgL
MKKIAVTLAILAMTGCATVVNDKNQTIQITASNGQPLSGELQEVKSTTVKKDGKRVKGPLEYTTVSKLDGTPVVVARSNAKKVVTVDTEGCQKETPVKSSVSMAFFGNIIIGGLLGSTTDSATGKMWEYQETVVVPCK